MQKNHLKKQNSRLLMEIEMYKNLTPSAIFAVDKDLIITSWNKMAATLTGYSEQEILGKACSLFAIEPCIECCGLFDEAKRKPISNLECKIKRKDGKIIPVLKNADLIYDEDGNITGGIESFIDISEIKKTQAKLEEYHLKLEDQIRDRTEKLEIKSKKLQDELEARAAVEEELRVSNEELENEMAVRVLTEKQLFESGSLLQVMLDATNDTIALLNKNGKIIKINQAGAKRLNSTPADLVGKNVYKLLPERLSKSRKLIIDMVFESGKSEIFDDIREDIYYENRVYPVIKDSGIVSQVVIFAIDKTKDKKDEMELRNALDFNQSVFIKSPVGMAVYRKDGQCIMANRAAADLVGTTTNQLLEQNYKKLQSWKKSGLTDEANNILNSGGTVIKEIKTKSTFGKNVQIECHFTRFYQNHEPHLLFIYNDVSEIREAEEKLKKVISSAPMVLFAIDANGTFKLSDGKGLQALGLKSGEVVGQSVFELYKDFPEITKEIKRALSGESIERVLQIGELVFETTISPVFNDKGKVEQIIGVSTNISKLYETRKKLEESEYLYKITTRAANIGIWDWKVDSDTVYYSEVWKSQLGYQPDELKNEFATWSNLLHPDDFDHCHQAVQNYLDNPEGPFLLQFRLKHKDGRYRWIFNNAKSFKDNKGKVLRMYGAHIDVTEQKEMLLKLENAKENLERSNKELEEFAYIASHDLQEPLRVVGSYVSLLARRYRDRLDQDAKEFIGYAEDGIIRMQKMINDFLNYSRVTTHGGSFSMVDPEVIIRQAMQNLKFKIEDSKADIVIENLTPFKADSIQLLNLFQNLISNSIKYRKSGIIPKVVISGKEMKNEVQIKVSDNGIGIKQDHHDRIFKIFHQLHSGKKYEGSGIGLAICKKIVDRHNGKIWFESEKERGTTFYILFPK